ncbi:MAG TPA: hypothetical protein VMF11_00670 [Candidatus Baltobacteraceae bacterium]|nr:hypothetical protein [Candidatus Baltobacteraceae bacterium]
MRKQLISCVIFSVTLAYATVAPSQPLAAQDQWHNPDMAEDIADALITSVAITLLTADDLNAYANGGTLYGPIRLRSGALVNKPYNPFVINGSPLIDGPVTIAKIEGRPLRIAADVRRFSIRAITSAGAVRIPRIDPGNFEQRYGNSRYYLDTGPFVMKGFAIPGPIDVPGAAAGAHIFSAPHIEGTITISNAIRFVMSHGNESILFEGPITLEGPVDIDSISYGPFSNDIGGLIDNPGLITVTGPITIDGPIEVDL